MGTQIAKNEQLREIAEKVTQKIQELSKTYLKLVEPKDFDEISRRFSMLTNLYIVTYLEKIDLVLRKLKISSSAAQLLERLLSLSARMVIIKPEIGLTRCVLVRERIAGFISRTITQIKNERLKQIRDHWAKKNKVTKSADKKKKKKKQVSLAGTAQVISIPSYDEFIGDFKTISKRKSEKSVRELIDVLIDVSMH